MTSLGSDDSVSLGMLECRKLFRRELCTEFGVLRFLQVGKEYKEGDVFCHIQTKWGEIIPVPAALGGKVVEIVAKQGKQIRRGDTIAWIERENKE